MTMNNNSIDLAQFDGSYGSEQVEERGEFDSLPDGKYQVNVEKAELGQAHTSGNAMLKWTLRIIAPTCVGRLLWRNSVITAKTLKFVKTDLHVCGLDLEKLSDLPKHLVELLDVKLEVTKRTKGENENIYFNRRIEAATGTSSYNREAGDALVPF
jgi:hypothetical protein